MAIAARTGGPAAEPNVTPMIDVMLVLLIIFMLVVPAVEDGFRAEPPRGEHLTAHTEDEATDHVLGIAADGRLFLDRRQIAPDTLGRRLEALYGGRGLNHVLYVKAHRDLDYGIVRNALAEASARGVRVTAMITEQRPSPGAAGRRP